MRILLALLLAAVVPTGAFAQDIIAKTDAKTPAEELKTFKAPAGFEVQLVASEPDIGKPIQIAFDSAGRLWVTTSREYPFAAEKGQGKDKLFILSEFDDTGKAKKIETFYDGLNIPIGILPLPDGKSCLVSEVGRILKLTDTKGTGKADKIEELFTGFGTEDTHGMTNSFLYMPDGWVYATHGFKNTSKVKAKDGSEITMNSGNTYRFKPDGSSIQIVTRGQVNPFGMCCDPYLNLYTADCHSKPITQLIRGAVYQSFGKPHDGLGFAPHVTNHSHGSTALCGLEWYSGTHFPKEYRDCMFLGNVVTNRINADRITFKGTTPVAEELPDFLTSSDPWFRPTDIKLGMDGALYFSDFYNKIIGHYEVDLKHPQRDKDRGRIWRIVYKGKGEPKAPATTPQANQRSGPAPKSLPPTDPQIPVDLRKAELDELYECFHRPNMTTKLAAFHEIVQRFETNSKLQSKSVREWTKNPSVFEVTMVSGLSAFLGERLPDRKFSNSWSIPEKPIQAPKVEQKNEVPNDPVPKKITKEEQQQDTGATMRALASKELWADNERKLIIWSLENNPNSPWVQRAVVDGIVLHPGPEFIQPLLKFIPTIPAEDTYLKHAALIALRDCFKLKDAWKDVDPKALDQNPLLIEMAIAVPNANSAGILAEALWKKQFPAEWRVRAAELVGRYGDEKQWDKVALHDLNLKQPEILEYLIVAQSFMKGIVASGRKAELYIKIDKNNERRSSVVTSLDERISDGIASQNEDRLRETMKAVRLLLQLVPAEKVPHCSAFENAALQCVKEPSYSDATKFEAIDVLSIDPSRSIQIEMAKAIQDEKLPIVFRARLAIPLLKSPTAGEAVASKNLIKAAPYAIAIQLAAGLAGDPFGADLLLAAVKAGDAPARLLQEKVVLDRLKATKVNNLDARVKELTAGIPSAEKRIDDIIKKRALAYPKAKADAKLGKEVFVKNCAACHTLENVGAKVGPQLDGIGVRGLERLLEDTLDPNRNVDAAFRVTKFDMLDGMSIVGLLLREEGAVYVVSDPTGKELRLAKADVDKKTVILQSAMPANVDTLVPEKDYYHLLAYLLEQKPK